MNHIERNKLLRQEFEKTFENFLLSLKNKNIRVEKEEVLYLYEKVLISSP